MDQNPYRNRLSAVRAVMNKRGIDALIVPAADPHLGEYVPDHWRVIRWLTGFSGSAGTVVITSKFAGLWTDSRYFIQAAGQLRDSGFELVRMKVPHTPEYIDWLAENLKRGSLAAVDGRLISVSVAGLLRGQLREKGIRLSLRSDLITAVWHDRPPLPDEEAFELPTQFAGESRKEKIYRVRERMKAMSADYQLLTACDDVMWLLNIRGRDVAYSPLLLSFAIVSNDQVIFFADEEKIPAAMKAEFDRDGVVLLPYEITASVLRSLPAGSRLLLSPSTTSAALRGAVPVAVKVIHDLSIPTRLKAIRNETEIKNLREVMIRDGVALTRFFIWLENSIGREKITELSATAKLESLRMEQEGCIGPSFATIAAFNDHSALPHYVPSYESDAILEQSGIFLLDSGGQYYGGTTDITRTVALGRPDPDMRKHFTLALRGTIDLALAKFPYGTRGYQLDLLARKALWDNGLNYGHGTGHGVGSFLNVHEGPQTIGSSASGDLKTLIEPGMVTSDEPAVYLEGKYGFRTENLILCVNDTVSDYGSFLGFETLTLCFIDRELTDTSLLDDAELQWLNDYHRRVFNMLSDRLKPDEREWLGRKTAALLRG